jgi:choline dehydrogenase-like flavoprotein
MRCIPGSRKLLAGPAVPGAPGRAPVDERQPGRRFRAQRHAQAERPNLQLYFNPATYTTQPGDGRRMMNTDPFPGFSMSVHACRPTSRGHVRITSRDPQAPPAITPNYLTPNHDRAEALAGARLLRALAGAAPLRD